MRTSLILLATAGNLIALASAQAPTPLCCMAYATVDEATLYIQGGAGRSGGSYLNNQFFSLDLTISGWNASSPPWKVLPVGAGIHSAPLAHSHAMTTTRDNKKLVVWGSFTGFSIYDLATAVWTNDTLYHPILADGSRQASMALDPTTGLVYVPAGVNKGTGMLVYDPVATNTTVVPMFPNTVLSFLNVGNSFVWSELRKSFLYFGGFNQAVFNQYMIEYQPSTYSWTQISTEGVQAQLASHCMVPAYNGTKMVVFGGWKPAAMGAPDQGPTYSSALYMLDVKTMNWTLLSDGEVNGRRSMACTVVGDNFVAWGGVDTTNQLASTQIYNLKSNRWVDQYVFTAVEPPPSNNKLGVFIGLGVLAAVCIGVLLGWIVFKCRKSRAAKAYTMHNQVSSGSVTPQDPQDVKTAMQWSPYEQLPQHPQAMSPIKSSP
ncbi:hypothetical protein F5H01DRAFT_410413 [Linnemannia elongata]|nr:hypothetical protein F5H01DRAFT_410413 [Linnemannia elongata]